MIVSRLFGWVALVFFVGTVWLANYAVKHWGFVDVGFGLEAPAGVYFAGIAFTLRDIVHRSLGRFAVIWAIGLGSWLSYSLEAGGTIPGGHVPLAVASAIAFLISELSDLSVYEPLRRRGWLPALAASNVVGLVLDSFIFITLALGFSWTLIEGQILGKAWMTMIAIPIIWALRKLPGRPVTA